MNWAMFWQFFPWSLVGALALFFLRDRRKNSAAAEVAEKTVDADITLKEVGAEDARLVMIAKAWDTERAGLERAIGDRDRELARKDAEIALTRADLDHAQTVISRLRDQIEDLQARLDDAQQQVNSVRQQLAELAGHDGTTTA